MNSDIKNNLKPAVNSFATVRIEDKSIFAEIEVTAPKYGGSDVTVNILNRALDEAGVCYGIKENVLKEIAEKKIYNKKIRVAEYTPPVTGKNGLIDYRFDRVPTALLVENEKGDVNYRELGLFKSVLKNTVIADITPPEEGIPGTDIFGREIAPKPVSKAAFTTGVGTVLSEDGLQIIAAIDGVINYEKSAFVLRRELNIKADIDFNTGNIQFIGDINIYGNVGEGFKVHSTGGNIVIYGAVFSGAEITAAGSVTLKKVCNHGTVNAGGSINAAFCEYSDLSSNGDITVQTVVFSTVYCGGTLVCSGKGGLIGGHYTILSGAVINGNIGSPHYPLTEILLGNNTVLADERERLSTEIARAEHEIIDLNMIVDYLNAKKRVDFTLSEEKEHLLGKSVRARILKNRVVSDAKKRIIEIEHLLENVQDLRMTVGGTVYVKTRICINTAKYEVKNEWKHVTIYVDKDNEFHFDTM